MTLGSSSIFASLREEIRQTGRSAGLDEVQTSVFAALVQWRECQVAPPEQKELRLEQLKFFNYLNNQRWIEVSSDIAQRSFDLLAKEVLSSSVNAQAIYNDAFSITALAPELDADAAAQVHQIITQGVTIDRLKLEKVESVFPLPIAGPSLLGKFVHHFDSGPEAALRHVRSAQASFHLLRDFSEWVHFGPPGAALLSMETPRETKGLTEDEFFDYVRSIVKQSAELLADREALRNPPTIIDFPALPRIPVIDREKAEFVQNLCTDVAKWILHGEAGEDDRAIMQSIAAKATGRRAGRYVPGVPSAYSELESYLKQFPKLAEFRASVAQAQKTESPIVFIVRNVTQEINQFAEQRQSANEVLRTEPLSLIIDRAFSPSAHETPEFKLFRDARWITGIGNRDPFTRAEQRHKVPGKEDEVSLTTPFNFKSTDLTLSVRSILSSTPKKHHTVLREEFTTELIKTVVLPRYAGVAGTRRFEERCRKEFGPKFTPAHEVEVALQLTPYLSATQFKSILSLLAKLGVGELTPESERIAQEKFHLRQRGAIKALESFAKHKPQTIGDLPPIFERLDLFDRYAGLGSVPFGVSRERQRLVELLADNNVVTLVDQQFYNQNLVPEIFGQKIAEDTEQTGEIWGRYVRGGGRVVMSLVRDIVDSESADLHGRIVVQPQSDLRFYRSAEQAIKKLFDFDVNWSADMALVSEVLGQLTTYCDRSLLFIDAGAAKSVDNLKRFLDMASSLGVKVVIRSRQSIPGIPSVTLSPWGDSEVAARLQQDALQISEHLELERIPDSIFEDAARRVGGFRGLEDDPLHLAITAVEIAAMRAHAAGSTSMHESDVAAAVTTLFRLPDAQQTQRVIAEIELLKIEFPRVVVGQDDAFMELLQLLSGHLSGSRDPGRPLSALMPGPTGVGKTEGLSYIAKRLSMPFYPIDGSRYGEEHSYAALLGSPTGYVGPDEGPLFEFADKNPIGLIFADEVDKMHAQVRRALMNLVDKGILTAGNSRQIHRPGLIIVGATNAGQFKLYRGMPTEDVHAVLAESLVDKKTQQKEPEVFKRWRVIVVPPLLEKDFKAIIRNNLENISNRPGVLTANMNITRVENSAVELVFERCRVACKFMRESGDKHAQRQGNGRAAQTAPEYYDMRFVNSTIDAMTMSDLNRVVKESHADGTAGSRSKRKNVRMEASSNGNALVLTTI